MVNWSFCGIRINRFCLSINEGNGPINFTLFWGDFWGVRLYVRGKVLAWYPKVRRK